MISLQPYGGEHHVPCIKDRGVRQLVQSMARFMAVYFTNETMYVFPPHSPQPLPSIHLGTSIKGTEVTYFSVDVLHCICDLKSFKRRLLVMFGNCNYLIISTIPNIYFHLSICCYWQLLINFHRKSPLSFDFFFYYNFLVTSCHCFS